MSMFISSFIIPVMGLYNSRDALNGVFVKFFLYYLCVNPQLYICEFLDLCTFDISVIMCPSLLGTLHPTKFSSIHIVM
ncbi:hypothetical protein Leryth_013160 [Lithospermum erythrorhizon]|nr:hypothetical protein Leryth_013160 [Lithospermum erythrorhizon]